MCLTLGGIGLGLGWGSDWVGFWLDWDVVSWAGRVGGGIGVGRGRVCVVWGSWGCVGWCSWGLAAGWIGVAVGSGLGGVAG